MFKNVAFAEWSGFVAVLAFVASVTVYLFFLIGALRTPRSKIDREAARPLENDKLS